MPSGIAGPWRVKLQPKPFCGHCEACRCGRVELCSAQRGFFGAGLPGGGRDVTSESVIPADARFSGVMDSRDAITVAGLPITSEPAGDDMASYCGRVIGPHPRSAPSLVIGTELQDDTYNVTINHDRPSTLPEDRGMFNARIFFAPAVIGEPFARGDVLSVDEVFETVADRSVRDLYAATADPLATGLNRFNYEFLSEETAIPGGSAR